MDIPKPPPPPDGRSSNDQGGDQAEAAAVSESLDEGSRRDQSARVPTGPPAESSFEAKLKQTTISSTPEAAGAAATSKNGLPSFAAATATGTSSSGDLVDFDQSPPQRRRTSSFEYSDDGTSQYDSLTLVPTGSTPISPLFLDLIHAKIREAERQLHFAILSIRHRDRLDASKRCACSLAELDYVRQRVVLPLPLQLLEVRILQASAVAAMESARYGDRILGTKKAENLIQRGFQVLGELIDWVEVKKRGAAIEILDEFLPMCYFNDTPSSERKSKAAEGVDFVETLALWYQMLIDHARITLRKAEWKEQELSRALKVENYAKAAKLFAVGKQGLEEISKEIQSESEDTVIISAIDPEIAISMKNATEGMEKIAFIMVESWKQDEMLEIIQSTSPRVDVTTLQIMILQARQKVTERKERREEAYKKSLTEKLERLRRMEVVNKTDEDESEDDEKDLSPIMDIPEDFGKGKGKAVENPATEDSSTATVVPVRVDKGKGKGKAVETTKAKDDKGLPSYFDSEISKTARAKDEKDEGDDWVIVQDFIPS